jgi:hypothetical protein
MARARACSSQITIATPPLLPPDPDVYLVIELTKSQYSVSSFALGGCPYFQAQGPFPAPSPSLVNDIISGHLSPAVMALFEGIEIAGKPILCFVQDSRQSIALDYTIVLGADFRINHTEPPAASIGYNGVLELNRKQPQNDEREWPNPAE